MDREAAPERQLRDSMVQRLIEAGAARSPRVVAAFRAVPRHMATPEVDPAKTYEVETATITKSDEHGVDIGSVSAPRIQAMQIEQAAIEPGMTRFWRSAQAVRTLRTSRRWPAATGEWSPWTSTLMSPLAQNDS